MNKMIFDVLEIYTTIVALLEMNKMIFGFFTNRELWERKQEKRGREMTQRQERQEEQETSQITSMMCPRGTTRSWRRVHYSTLQNPSK